MRRANTPNTFTTSQTRRRSNASGSTHVTNQDLPKIDKLRLMQFFAKEPVKEEEVNFFVGHQEYSACSPYNCSEAANVLMNLLATKQQEQNG
jgi:hypothetical protein